MPRQVLVTGAGGFIGSHLVEALVVSGARVRAMVHYNGRGDRGALSRVAPQLLSDIEVVAGDLCDPFFVRRAVKGCEVVFHLAALVAIPYSYTSAAHVYQSNMIGTLHVAQACLDEGVSRLVHTSTSEVYGTAQQVPITEAHALTAQSPYAASKIAADKCIESFHRSFALPAVTIRPFNTYGPRQSGRAVVPAILAQALLGHEVRLGALSPTRDLTYVTDTAHGFVLAGEKEGIEGQVIQLAQGQEISIGELARLCLQITGNQRPILCDPVRLRPAESEVMRLLGDADRARRLLGWAPRVTLEEGLSQTAEYIRLYPLDYRPQEYQR